jgi:hypothetical protein
MTYDGIILGAGHNGLILQAYMGRAGLKTICLDRLTTAGGGLTTIVNPRRPGFLHNTHSFFHRALTQMPWYRDLELERRGAVYIEPDLNVAMVLRNGEAFEWWTDFENTAASVERFSARDANTLRRWRSDFQGIVETILVPLFATDPRVNHAEVFYSIVPDPDGTLSCAHSRAQVKRILPVTFIHEFQHMISYNHHVLVRDGDPEVLWLNEALSHYAEELGGESFLAEGDTSRFRAFLLGNLFNAKDYLTAPENYFLFPSEGIGTLVERGAGWLYLRYRIDQYAADTTLTARNAFTRALGATANTGSANIVARTGTTIDTSATRWALANWVDDLPGLTPPPELQYAFWDLRYWYGKLHNENMAQFPTAFPLAPPMAPGNVTQAAGVLRSGSPVYRRATSAPGAPSFTLRFGTERLTLFATSLRVRVSIVRTR